MLFTEIKRRLLRNCSRTLLLILVATLLCGSMALYLGNVNQSRAALESMGESVPVTARIISGDGTQSSGLAILDKYYDALCEAGVHDVRVTATAVGALDENMKKQNEEAGQFITGDVQIVGVNCLEAYPMKKMTYEYADGESEACLAGNEAKCLLDGVYAKNHKIKLGDQLELPIYLYIPDIGYQQLSDGPVTVAGTYTAPKEEESVITMLLPVAWMRMESEQSGLGFFSYDSCHALVNDPLNLNTFKDKMAEAGFVEPVAGSEFSSMGDSISIEDKLFIKSVGEIEENLNAYRAFTIPFFVLVIGLVTLVIFLTLRSARKEMAIAVSLGQSKAAVALSHFFSVFLADLIGCVIALPIMIIVAGLPMLTAFIICGLFLFCAAVGTTMALVLILRFDAMDLLTKLD